MCVQTYIYMYSWSFCCIAEINTTLEINYTSINEKQLSGHTMLLLCSKTYRWLPLFSEKKPDPYPGLSGPTRYSLLPLSAQCPLPPLPARPQSPSSLCCCCPVNPPNTLPLQGLHYLCWEWYIYATGLSHFFSSSCLNIAFSIWPTLTTLFKIAFLHSWFL